MVELTGRVKWFAFEKGYGFITVGDDDYFLHMTQLPVLDNGKRDYPGDGATCVFVPKECASGLKIERLISIDHSTETKPPRLPAIDAKVHDPGKFEIATVKWFRREKGFGFLTRGVGTQDIFLHMETLRKAKMDPPKEGEALLVRFGSSGTGLMAAEVKPLVACKAAG